MTISATISVDSRIRGLASDRHDVPVASVRVVDLARALDAPWRPA